MNSLIKTDGFFFKIKIFFKKLFKIKTKQKQIKNVQNEINTQSKKSENYNFKEKLSYQRELEHQNKIENIARKLKSGEIQIEELQDNSIMIDEMIDYFDEDINKKKNELENIKNNILNMRKELANGKN